MRPTTKIDLLAAVQAASADHQATELTLAELVRAFSVQKLDGTDQRLRKWMAAFGQQSAWSLTPELLETAARALLAHGYAPASVNRDLSSLGSVYRWAKERRLSARGFKSPTLGVPRFEEPIRRIHLESSDLERLRTSSLAFPDRRFGVFVALLLETGARKSELLQRRWVEVDLAQRQMLAPTTKNGTPRILFFSDETAALMQRVYSRRHAGALLFEGRVPNQPISYRASWKLLTSGLGLDDLHMHDVRHAAAANLLRAGVTLAIAAQVLGHDPAVLARRYGHLETASLRQAQEEAWRNSRAASGLMAKGQDAAT